MNICKSLTIVVFIIFITEPRKTLKKYRFNSASAEIPHGKIDLEVYETWVHVGKKTISYSNNIISIEAVIKDKVIKKKDINAYFIYGSIFVTSTNNHLTHINLDCIQLTYNDMSSTDTFVDSVASYSNIQPFKDRIQDIYWAFPSDIEIKKNGNKLQLLFKNTENCLFSEDSFNRYRERFKS